MPFFQAVANNTHLTDTTVRTTVVSDFTTPNNTTPTPFIPNDSDNWMYTVFPALALMMFALYLFRLCYQAIQEPEKSNTPSNNHYTSMVV